LKLFSMRSHQMLGRSVRGFSSLPENVSRLGPYSAARNANVRLSVGWPRAEEVEREKSWGTFTPLSVVKEQSAAIVAEKQKKDRNRLDKIIKNEMNYGAMLKKYENSQMKAEKEKDEKDAVMERRMREIHEYFGYWMDPKDPRFEVMLQQKEAQEKMADKLAKRAELVKKKIAEVM
ncbi:hypothetical protein PMAYCL1PPCAC_23760, partial [Pristionchus mayeri]